jgi:selenocysteine lyase/cysteine desulfurase
VPPTRRAATSASRAPRRSCSSPWRASTCAALAARRINVAVNGLAYTPLDMAARGLDEIVRASVHADTTDADLARLVDALTPLSSGR